MMIATVSANSIRARRSVVIRRLDEHQADVRYLQETTQQTKVGHGVSRAPSASDHTFLWAEFSV